MEFEANPPAGGPFFCLTMIMPAKLYDCLVSILVKICEKSLSNYKIIVSRCMKNLIDLCWLATYNHPFVRREIKEGGGS